jgi:hypothetical protein
MAAEELFPEWSFLFWQANRALTYESHGGINTFGERIGYRTGGAFRLTAYPLLDTL